MMNSGQDVKLRFERGQASADVVQEAIDKTLAQLRHPNSEAARHASMEGLDPAELGTAQVTVEESEQGAEPVVTTILVGIAVKLGSDAIIKAWDKVLWPSIEKQLGGLALGKQLPDEQAEKRQPEEPGQ